MKREISKLEQNKEKINSTKIIRNCELNVSPSTLQRRLSYMGWKYEKAKNEIVLSEAHKSRRIDIITS